MPVWKYRSIEETPEVSTVRRNIPIGRRMRAIARMGGLVEPLGLPRGVRRFRSADEAHAERERYERARIERIRSHK